MQVETPQDQDKFGPEGHERQTQETPLPSLTELYPDDVRNLDDLFPEAKFRALFKDVAAGLADVDNFVRRIDLELTSEKRSGAYKVRSESRAVRRPRRATPGTNLGALPWKQT
jgi:hypothetical protein